MPWCSFPWHKLLPRLTQKTCYTVYSHLQSKFDPCVYILVFNEGYFCKFAQESLPGKQAKVETGHQCFSVVAQAKFQDSPKASPRADLARGRERKTFDTYMLYT